MGSYRIRFRAAADYTGPVVVVGSDHYGLDADGDG